MTHDDLATWIGSAGVALLLVAFLLNLLKLLRAETCVYMALNLVGAGLACYSSYLIDFMPFVVLEGVWALVALMAMVRMRFARVPAQARLRGHLRMKPATAFRQERLRLMRGPLWHALLALGIAAGAFAAPPEIRPPTTAEAMFPVYMERSQNPRTWDGIAEALKRAGVNNAIVAIRVRPTAVWTAHVDLAPDNYRPARRAIVSSDLTTWKVLCMTSATEDCSRYGR